MASGFNGGAEMIRNLKNFKTGFPAEVGRALYQESNVEATEVRKRTPVEFGALRGSVHVLGPFIDGNRIWCLIVCGGTAAPYAIIVHENLNAFHKVGQAKFLESVILESRNYMGVRVARRIDLNRAMQPGSASIKISNPEDITYFDESGHRRSAKTGRYI